MPTSSTFAFATPSPGERSTEATAVPVGKRRRSRSTICLRVGMMKATPRVAPAMQAATSQTVLIWACSPSRKSTGTVKITPEFEVFTVEATVCARFVSTIVPLRKMPRSTPQPSTAAIAEPPIVKPIFRPE